MDVAPFHADDKKFIRLISGLLGLLSYRRFYSIYNRLLDSSFVIV